MRTTTKALFVAVLVAVTAGCSSPDKSKVGDDSADVAQLKFLGYDAYVAEYDKTKGSLAFPPGYPKDRVRHEPKPTKPSSWQLGAGAEAAVCEWNCAWGARYVTQAGQDPRAARSALAAYASLRQRPEWADFWAPETQQMVNDAIADAELGDPSGIRGLVEVECVDLL